MKNRKWTVFLYLLILSFPTFAQDIYQFNKGLALSASHQYGREALYTDFLAHQLYTGTLKSPSEGQVALTGKAKTWKAIAANQENKFKDSTLANGYLYLTYESKQEQAALLNISGHSMVYVNGEPRTGDIYADGWLYLPVILKKGLNEFYVRGSRFSAYGGITAKLILNNKPVILRKEDATLPHVVLGSQQDLLWGAMVVINATSQPLTNLQFRSQLSGKEVLTKVPAIPPMTTRKVGFQINAANLNQKGQVNCQVTLLQKDKILDEQEIKLEAVSTGEHFSSTFISGIDGSVQYYGIAPQAQANGKAPALFLSVHGAGVEAIGQAKAYQPKNWGVVVTPTNRRPRGFNWEDWGRLDALEVFEIAKNKYKPDPKHIYLTGHSMGGHGTWYLGATFPGKWAAIAPCAGYPTLSAYGSADGKIPETKPAGVEQLILQASNGSNVLELARNYTAGGVYIHHGDADKVVSVDYARQMKQVLSGFHPDFSYYEYPGGSHWFGNESVDWPPIFDYFKWHTIPEDSAVNKVDFTTANTAVSSNFHWVSVLQQKQTLQYSRVKLIRDKKAGTITGTTENIAALKLDLTDFAPGKTVSITLDNQPPISYQVKSANDIIYLKKASKWQLGGRPSVKQKGVLRNGTFKEAFNHQMVFVYSTGGTEQENAWSFNKARYDAEVWYYRGNGAVDIVADKDFKPSAYRNRGVIIYGNATTNKAWKSLLAKSPIQVQRGSVQVGNKKYTGNDLGAYFMWPRPDSEIASVAVVAGSGLPGMQAADANQYFAGGSGFPDYMIFSLNMLTEGAKGIKQAGFYGNDWTLQNGQSAMQE